MHSFNDFYYFCESPVPASARREILSKVNIIGVATVSRWQKYLKLRLQVIDLETSLAEEWLSPELLSALRAENLRSV